MNWRHFAQRNGNPGTSGGVDRSGSGSGSGSNSIPIAISTATPKKGSLNDLRLQHQRLREIFPFRGGGKDLPPGFRRNRNHGGPAPPLPARLRSGKASAAEAVDREEWT